MGTETTLIVPMLAAVLIFFTIAFLRMLQTWQGSRVNLAAHDHDSERLRLEDAKDRILTTLRDLDFEFKMGKLSPQDHDELRVRVEKEAMDIIKALDALT